MSPWLIDFIYCHHVLKKKLLIKTLDYATSAWVKGEFDFMAMFYTWRICETFGLGENLIETDVISPSTSTFVLSNWTMCTAYFWGVMFNFVHTTLGIIFEEALESTRQLWTLLLKISYVSRNGGTWEIYLSPIRTRSEGSTLFEDEGGFPIL